MGDFIVTIHHYAALCWLICAPWVFAPALEATKRPDAASVVAWGVVVVAAMILLAPSILRWPTMQRWYGWTDAFSENQKQALAQRDLHRYYRSAYADAYLSRVIPYLWRYVFTVAVLMTATILMPGDLGHPALVALSVFATWYPIGVMLVILLSCPVARMIASRFGR